MKKIIDGKLYDTEKAECIADEGRSLHNFYSTSEALYRTASGAWFIHGESSAGGKYSKWNGNSCGWGEDIVPLEPDEVLAWAEQASIDSEEQARIAELIEVVPA